MTTPPQVSPDEIANHQFTLARRGFDPDEVRAFLITLSDSFRQCQNELTQLRDQLALGASGSRRETELRTQLAALQSQVADLGNRLVLANAVREDALARVAELEFALGQDFVPTPLHAASTTAAAPAQADGLDRASNEIAEVLREAKIRAAHIKADAEREATLHLEQARREQERIENAQRLAAEEAAIALQERLAEICREAEARVVEANTEAARVLAEADETAARALDHASFQARRLVANAGSFTAIWVAETEELRAAGVGPDIPADHPALTSGRSVHDALVAFQVALESAEDPLTDTSADADADISADAAVKDGAEDGAEVEAASASVRDVQQDDDDSDDGDDAPDQAGPRLEAVEDPAQLLKQADQLLSIAEIVRRAEFDHPSTRTDSDASTRGANPGQRGNFRGNARNQRSGRANER